MSGTFVTGRAVATGWKRTATVAALAYALAVQAMLLSFGGALHPGALGPAQGIVCANGEPAHEPANQPAHTPADARAGLCCLLGCNGASAAPAGPGPAATGPRLYPLRADMQ